jgi:phosphatidylserine/phosphatidylglycerophosphate/cardiolipin synthase-like enzyme
MTRKSRDSFASLVGFCLGLAGCELAPGALAAPTAATSPADVDLMVLPDDGATSLMEAVRGARQSVLVEMYMLTAPEAVSAFLAARGAGADVRVLLEPAPYGDPTANEAAYVTLAAAGIDVRWTNRGSGLVHTKLIVLDDATAYVMTLNLTGAGLAGNREYAVADRDPADVGWAAKLWSIDAIGADSAPAPASESAGSAQLLVSPLNARAALGALIDAARSTILLEIEEISDGDLVTRLIAARLRGVATEIVAPASNRSTATTAALDRLATAGVMVHLLAAPVVHAKAMVTDARWLYVGSMNFTRASLDDNREVGLVLGDPAAVTRVADVITADARVGFAF